MIYARFTESPSAPIGELLGMVRARMQQAKREAEQLLAQTRGQLAQRGWALRRRLHQRFVRTLSRERARLQALQNIEAEMQFNRVVANAHRDCLEVALTVAREVVAELLANDVERVAARVQRGLERLSHGRVLSVEVQSGAEQKLQPFLERFGHPLPVKGATDLTAGVVRLITAHGPVELPWEEEFAEIASRLRSVLETRIAAASLKEAA